jgi:hypothetical protein
MRQALEVLFQDGTVEKVIAFYPDYVKFEERFDRNPIVVTFDDFRLTNQGFLAWAALTREKRTALPWEEWINTVENVKALDDEVEHPPLESSQPIGSLPDSQ